MMHITEDTPPDMLAGAMDLTVHLPTGRSVKMSVERSTPMMDLLVQIVTAHQLQLSGHILEALEMAPSTGISDKVLPYKPNTPIGALDTQHIRVVPKNKSIPSSKSASSGHQPFESTFRLKVHLPRNQLYVTRVSQNVYLEDIMNKVCKEKDLDPVKYEFRHPGNLDEVLDPKLTLSDYQITEIYVVSKGTGRLTQAFSTSDIMALRKEEERKQFQAKTGGGVFNLIFKRGKSNPANGSISSDNRSISPTHSDDSRSVTPPGIQPPQIIKEPPAERPKPPQRKRRPAPKPPQAPPEEVKVEKPASQISNTSNQSDTSAKRPDNGLIICHSRNSSDSSGYHEASILSDNCNTSLPRRPRTMIENEDGKLSGEHSRSTGNLTKTSLQYKSTTSLALHGRKKKAAPPPPPMTTPPKPITSNIKPENTSPVVASQPVENLPASLSVEGSRNTNTAPLPAPRRNKLAHLSSVNRPGEKEIHPRSNEKGLPRRNDEITIQDSDMDSLRSSVIEDINAESEDLSENSRYSKDTDASSSINTHKPLVVDIKPYFRIHSEIHIAEKIKTSEAAPNNMEIDLNLVETSLSLQSDINPYLENIDILHVNSTRSDVPKSPTSLITDDCYLSDSRPKSGASVDSDFSIASTNSKGSKPEIVGVIPKRRKQTNFDTLTRKRGFHIGSSLIGMEIEDDVYSTTSVTSDDKVSLSHISLSSKTSDYSTNANDYEMNDINEEIFRKSTASKTEKHGKERHINELLGVHEFDLEYNKSDGVVKDQSITSLRSIDSIPGFMNGGNMKKWKNIQDLDDISLISNSSLRVRNKWTVGDYSDTESVSTVPTNQTPPESTSSSALPASTTPSTSTSPRTSISNTHSPNPDKNPELSKKAAITPPPTPQRTGSVTTELIKQTETDLSVILSERKNEADSGICDKEDTELDTVWRYQLPSPPKAFRDASPVVPTSTSHYDTETLPDSVVTNPELFEKLQYVKDIQDAESDIPSVVDDKDICNKLTLEHLEKRKSLVYNRELATSLKFAQENDSNDAEENKSYDTIASKVIQELEDVITNSSTTSSDNKIKDVAKSAKVTSVDRNLPNFQISSYDTKKDKINIFEDDTIRSNVTRSDSNLKSVVKPEICIRNKAPDKGEIPKSPPTESTTTKRTNSISEPNEKPKEGVFKKPVEINTYRLKNSFYDKNKNVKANANNTSVSRGGSFSIHSENWTPSVPVKRSKSQIALNKYKEDRSDANDKTENLSKSNSLLDVSSSLQSIEVMKKIQNKLSNSKEELDAMLKDVPPCPAEEHVTCVEEKPAPPPKTTPAATHTTISWSPPSINLSSWSQRPKTQVMVKEDTDYKFSTKINTSSTSSETDMQKPNALNTTPSFSSYNRSNGVNASDSQLTSNGVSIKVNGSEAISSQKSGNVVIKIGGTETTKELDTSASRFINHITPEGYRKPFGNINKIERGRPHSIAFDNQFDISRVPVVRSVELKKPFKDLQNNKSITQIYSNSINVNEDEPESLNYNNTPACDDELKNEKKHSNVYFSNESINKPAFRNNNFTPVVKGFRMDSNPLINRKIWGGYGTLPSKPTGDNQTESNTNRNMPFSQMNLRRTESNKMLRNQAVNSNVSNFGGNVVLRNNNNNVKATVKTSNNNTDVQTSLSSPPPQLPKETAGRPKSTDTLDARADLLSAIRNFGGKNGLRASKG